jgi:SAM-dependent methyltransferase
MALGLAYFGGHSPGQRCGVRAAGRMNWRQRPQSQAGANGGQDLAGVAHWEAVYKGHSHPPELWEPHSYHDFLFEGVLSAEVARVGATSLLEVGCGDSPWLGYLARKHGLECVTGLDYSPLGCDLAKKRLSAAGVEGRILCRDFLEGDTDALDGSDVVFSLGLVEHFRDIVLPIRRLVGFVRRRGVLVTIVPNLRSIHGLMAWAYHPTVLAKHRLLSYRDLVAAYAAAGVTDLRGGLLGGPSVWLVAWGIEPRWPTLDPWVLKCVSALSPRVDGSMKRRGVRVGLPGLAPYIWIAGSRP